MSKLLFIPRPLSEESPTSLLKRMAVMHGCKLQSDLQCLFGRTYFNGSLISRSHPVIQDLSRRAGVAGEEFLNGFYESIGALDHAPPLQINGITVNANIIRKKGTAYCSECWREGHEHFIKDLKLSSYCPYHLKKYLTNCPGCHLNLCWYAPLDETCRCKHVLVSPSCLLEEAVNEKKLLEIFRAGEAEKLSTLVSYLTCLGYRLESDSECPGNRCLLSIAFALLEDDMAGVLAHLIKLKTLYSDVPKFIIAAKLALFPQAKIRNCVLEFIKQASRKRDQEKKTNTSVPIHTFSLTHRQISAWLKVRQHHWKILHPIINLKTNKSRYSWNQALTISQQVLQLKLGNGFKKKKMLGTGITTKNLQKLLQLSVAAIKSAVDERLLTPSWGAHRKMFFDPKDVEDFSEKFISIQLLSSQTKIATKQIRNAMKRMKIAPLGFANRKLRLHLMSAQTRRMVIEWCSDINRQHRRSFSRRSPSLERYIPIEGEVWLPTAAAAEHLGICISGVIDLIKFGLLTNARRNTHGGGYCIDKKVLDDFKKKFVGSVEAGKLFDCGHRMAIKMLKSFGVVPVTGPGIDDNPLYFYSRIQLSSYANTIKQFISEKSMGYTILQACEKLQVPASTISTMVKSRRLKLAKGRLLENVISCRSIDTFYEHYAKPSTIARWLKVPVPCVLKVLSKLNIAPVDGDPIETGQQSIYAIGDVAQYFDISHRQKNPDLSLELEPAFVNATVLWEKYDIRGSSFGRIFLSSGYTNPIKIGSVSYLVQADVLKVEKILENYCTAKQADRYLGLVGHAGNLIKRKKLIVTYPLNGDLRYPMIDKTQLNSYAIKHGFVQLISQPPLTHS